MYKYEQMRNNIVFKQFFELFFCQIVLYIGSQRIEIMVFDMLKLMYKQMYMLFYRKKEIGIIMLLCMVVKKFISDLLYIIL